MKKIKSKILLIVSIILSVQFFISGMNTVRADENNSPEEIIILDESKINVGEAKHFAFGDIEGDQISEVITFKSFVRDSGTQWIINTYRTVPDIWYPVLSREISEKVSGHIHKADVGNFDNDLAEEIVIASWEGNSSKIYLLDFNRKQNEFMVQVIYELNSRISDLEIHSNGGDSPESIYILFSENTDSAEHFKTNVMILDRDETGLFKSTIQYSESKKYWSLFTIGQFIEQEPYTTQILLYQYKTTESIMREAIVKIITSDGKVIMEDVNIGTYSMIRDIVAWDRNKGATDELCILDIKNMGDDRGFNSKMIYCTFNHNGLLEKEDRLVDSNRILNQLCIEKQNNLNDKLLILDPYLGTVVYARFFDEEARDWYDFFGYTVINIRFDGFEMWYDYDLDILVSSSGNYDYTSSGSTTDQLFNNFRNQVNLPSYYGAHIAIAVCRDAHDDWTVGGKSEQPGVYSIIFSDIDDSIISHEVGHNYGLYKPWIEHCPRDYCIMYEDYNPFIIEFCDTCENLIDKDEFGPPPGGGGGCPILYTFNGTRYIEEGLLDIHDINGNDRTYFHPLQTAPYPLNNKIHLKLTEHPKTISTIDQVRLYGRLENGQWVSLRLKSAIHSTIGEVRSVLKHSDDLKVTTLGEDHNNGISEFIDLEFNLKGAKSFLEFVFIIEGNNEIVK